MKKQLRIIGMGAACFVCLAVVFVYAASADPFDQALKTTNRYKCKSKRSGRRSGLLALTISSRSVSLASENGNILSRPRIHAGINNDWGQVHLGWARFGTFTTYLENYDLQVEKSLIQGFRSGRLSKTTSDGFDVPYTCLRIN